jgi:hypothetical protein
MAADSIFVTALTTTSGTVTLTTYSGTSSQDVEAGVNVLAFPMVAGQQTVTLTTSDGRTGSSTGAIEVLGDSCYVRGFSSVLRARAHLIARSS